MAAELVGDGLSPFTQDRAGRHPAHHRKGGITELLQSTPDLDAQHIHAGGDERGRDIGHDETGLLAHVVDHRRLEARKGEFVALRKHGPREVEDISSRRGQSIQDRATGVAQAQIPGHLVVSLADGVVHGLAEEFIHALAPGAGEHAVAAGDQERGLGKGDVAVGEEDAGQVAVEVVHPHDRQPPSEGQRLSRGYSDQEGPDQPRSCRDRDGTELGPCDSRLGEGLIDQGGDQFHVGSARQFRDDPAELGVEIDLARHHGRAHLIGVADHGSRGLVAGGLDGEQAAAHEDEASAAAMASPLIAPSRSTTAALPRTLTSVEGTAVRVPASMTRSTCGATCEPASPAEVDVGSP